MSVFFSSMELVKIAVRNEEMGFDFYRLAAERAKTPELKRLFDDLAVQEQAHKEKFLGFMKSIQEPAQPAERPADPDETGRYIAAMTDNRLFDGPDKNIALATKASDEKSAVEFALGFEKDTLLFFLPDAGTGPVRGSADGGGGHPGGEESHPASGRDLQGTGITFHAFIKEVVMDKYVCIVCGYVYDPGARRSGQRCSAGHSLRADTGRLVMSGLRRIEGSVRETVNRTARRGRIGSG